MIVAEPLLPSPAIPPTALGLQPTAKPRKHQPQTQPGLDRQEDDATGLAASAEPVCWPRIFPGL